MFKPVATFSGISVNDLAAAKEFYTQKLGLKIKNETMGLNLELPHDATLFVYEKADHQPAAFTVLNFVVEDIDEAVDGLVEAGVELEHYEFAHQDDKGIARGKSVNMGPDIAWFTDPAGNILSVLAN